MNASKDRKSSSKKLSLSKSKERVKKSSIDSKKSPKNSFADKKSLIGSISRRSEKTSIKDSETLKTKEKRNFRASQEIIKIDAVKILNEEEVSG